MMNKTIIQYVRNRKGLRIGAIVATKSENGFNIGYSLCNKKDRFNKEMALKIAFGRAEFELVSPEIPRDISKMLPEFIERCKKYYRTQHEPKFRDYFQSVTSR
jgi:actin-like ATPase involved in cell morphogenesis